MISVRDEKYRRTQPFRRLIGGGWQRRAGPEAGGHLANAVGLRYHVRFDAPCHEIGSAWWSE